MKEYTVELEAVLPYTPTPVLQAAFHDALSNSAFLGPSVGGGRDGLRVMGQIKAPSANIALAVGRIAYRGALRVVFGNDELEWTTVAVAPYREPVESIPTPIV